MKRLLFYLFSLFLLAYCNKPNSNQLESYLGFKIQNDSLNNFLDFKMKKYKIPGLSLAIINDNKIVYSSYKGYKNIALKEPITSKTIFEGASISKSVFAYFVMKFVEEGKLDLNKPLYQYLPYQDIANDKRYKKITAKMVLCHRSGMPNWREGEDDKKLKLKFNPNTQYGYSGEAYQYLAMVLKKISNTDWNGLEKLFQEKVAIPLKMKHTVFIQNAYTRKNKAEPYDKNEKWIDWKNNYWFKKEDSIFYAPSSIHTEPIDFSKWMLAIMNNKGLSKKSFEVMLTPYSDVPVDELNIKYTLGFNKLDYPFTDVFFHGGDNEGFTSLYVFDKSKKWGFILFANSENGSELGKDLFFYLITGPNKTKLYTIVIIGIISIIISLFFFIKWLKYKINKK